MKNLVIYHSETKKTKIIADAIVKKLGGEERHIAPVKKGNFLMNGYRAKKRKKVDIMDMDYNLDGYDTIFLGCPIWAASPTPAMNTFLSKADFKDKSIVLFCTMAGEDPGKALVMMREEIEAKGGAVKGMFSVRSAKAAEKDMLEKAEAELARIIQII